MALIKCPECGQTVLSVATQCPRCSHRLASAEPGEAVEPNELTHCRHCNELFTRRAKRCPHCGQSQRRKAPVVVASTGAVLVLGVGAIVLSGREGSPPPAIIVQATQPSRGTVPAPPSRDSAEVDAAPPAPALAPDSSTTAVTTTRFAQNWANVRDGRTLQSTIIAILRPGQEVAVADRQGGWWSIYLGDSLVGYVSANLLGTTAPE